VEGQPLRFELTGFISRVIQHEYDHLEGVLLVDRMSPADRLRNKVALEEMIKDYKERQAQV
jgi:peptide deformylase